MASRTALIDHMIALRAEVARMRKELGISEEEAKGRSKAAVEQAVDQLHVQYQSQQLGPECRLQICIRSCQISTSG